METKTLKPTEKIKTKSSKKITVIVACIIVLLIVACGCYFLADRMGYVKAFKMARQYVKQTELSKEDKVILEQLKKIMLLPEEETPTMAIIQDVEKLKTQQPGFFTDAKNGDRLIIYPNQAIIFDAVANKIIKVGPVQLNEAQQQAQAQPVYFAVYNGSGDDSKLKAMEDKIKATFTNAVIKVSQNASNNDYTKTIIIDLTGDDTDLSKVAEALGAQVSTLPEGEAKPDGAMALVIIGKE